MRSRKTLLPPPIVGRAEDPDYQSWYAEAAGMIGTVEAALFGAIRRWQDICGDGPFSRLDDLRITTICRHIIQMCWAAAERYLFPTAGSSAPRAGERLDESMSIQIDQQSLLTNVWSPPVLRGGVVGPLREILAGLTKTV